MDKEELNKLISEAVEKATAGLQSKNAELLADLKKAKDDKKELQKSVQEIEDAKRAAEEDAVNKSGDIEKIKSQLTKKHQDELSKVQEMLNSERSNLNALLIDGGISDAIAKANIAPQFHDAVKALLKYGNKPEIQSIDGKPQGIIDGKSIQEFVNQWSQSDAGKHYVAAPNNAGAGAKGSNSNASGGAVKNLTREKFDALNPAEKMAFSKEVASGNATLT